MARLKDLLQRVLNLFRPNRMDDEMLEEMQHHIDVQVERYKEQGMGEKEARSAAMRRFGNALKIQDDERENRTIAWVENLYRDIRYSVRSLWVSKGFSFAVVATLSLCIGGNTAVYTVLYDLVFRPLPVDSPDRLVEVFNIGYDDRPGYQTSSSAQYLDFQENADLFEEFALVSVYSRFIEDGEAYVMVAMPQFFDFLGIEPVLGRLTLSDDVAADDAKVVILTETEWEHRFGADPNVIGQEIPVPGRAAHTIIGVAPRSLERIDNRVSLVLLRSAQVSISASAKERRLGDSGLWGRIKPGVSHGQALAQLNAIERRFQEQRLSFEALAAWDRAPQRFAFGRPNPYRSNLLLLQAGALLVLLIGCVNVANLFLARSFRRSVDLSIRASFGASRFSIARMMLSESVLLTLLGAAGGILLAIASIHVINDYLIVIDPRIVPVEVSALALSITAGVAFGIAFVMAMAPLLLLWKSGRALNLEGETRAQSRSSGSRSLSSMLVVSQVALTFVLLVGAGLLFKSFRNVLSVDPGFDETRIVQGWIGLPIPDSQASERIALREHILDALREVPGVEDACFIKTGSLVGDSHYTYSFEYKGEREIAGRGGTVKVMLVSSNFFESMGIGLLEGRGFLKGESRDASIIVDEAFADQFGDGRSVIGRNMRVVRTEYPNLPFSQVVGVVQRANFQGLDKRDGEPIVYVCIDQDYGNQTYTLVIRSERPKDSLVKEVRDKLLEIHPRLKLQAPTSLDVDLGEMQLYRQGIVDLAGTFAILALLLSGIGIYGVLSYDVVERKKEIGIRAAIGATRARILSLVLRQGMLKTGVGLALGLLGAAYFTHYLESQLFDVTVLDVWTYGTVFVSLIVIAFIASYLPARRAVRVDPVDALRAE